MTKDFTTTELFSDRTFDPKELVAIYFGCRTPEQCKATIKAAARDLGTPISLFQMRDERIRFKLTAVPLEI